MEVAQDALDDIELIGADGGNDLHAMTAVTADAGVILPCLRDELGPAALAFPDELGVLLVVGTGCRSWVGGEGGGKGRRRRRRVRLGGPGGVAIARRGGSSVGGCWSQPARLRKVVETAPYERMVTSYFSAMCGISIARNSTGLSRELASGEVPGAARHRP